MAHDFKEISRLGVHICSQDPKATYFTGLHSTERGEV